MSEEFKVGDRVFSYEDIYASFFPSHHPENRLEKVIPVHSVGTVKRVYPNDDGVVVIFDFDKNKTPWAVCSDEVKLFKTGEEK